MFDYLAKFIQDKYRTNSFIPLHEPRFIGKEKEFVSQTIDSTFVSSVGQYVNQFEEDIAKYTGSKRAIAIVNGTSALHLSMLMAGVKPGDYVITQALTFVATCNAIHYCQAEPILIDVDKKTLGLSPIALEAWLEENAFVDTDQVCKLKNSKRAIKACIPMHTFGHPVEIDTLATICSVWKLAMIEDAAESLGSLFRDTHTGTFGLMGTLSFNGNKIITTGGGGAILCNEELYLKGKHLSTTAKKPNDIHFVHDDVGFNYRLPNINAALGCAQLESINLFVTQKRQLAEEYAQLLKNSNLEFFKEPKNCRSNYWLNTIICHDESQRNELLNYMNSREIMTRPVWTPMNKLPMFKNSISDSLQNTFWLEERIVNIPSSPPPYSI
ncbi:LegC family aminotransferase [Gammaproteobacteria bacterium]|nr:LegC family aminotransferase [Gammaproteobacteria bacterium]